jgi:ubiquinone biosynthesis protein COQ9
MDKPPAKTLLLKHLLPIVAFEGWTPRALEAAAAKAGVPAENVIRIFPGGVADALAHFAQEADAAMLAAYAALSPAPQKIREKITALVWLRLQYFAQHREAVRRAKAYYAFPHHAPAGLKVLHNAVDAMWIAAGDASHDMNWYSKRLLLAGVYSATLLFWLNDDSENASDTRAFLERRIANVMQIESLKQRVKKHC